MLEIVQEICGTAITITLIICLYKYMNSWWWNKMINENQVYVGNKFIGDINYEKFEIVNIINDNGVVYVVIEDKKKKRTYVTMERFKNLLITEIES